VSGASRRARVSRSPARSPRLKDGKYDRIGKMYFDFYRHGD